jgi:hypothetical protein
MKLPRQRTQLLGAIGLLAAAIWWVSSPGVRQIDPDEEVAFYTAYLHWDTSGQLNLVLFGRLYEPERSSSVRRALVDRLIAPSLFDYIDKQPEDFDDESRRLMYDRLAPFLYDGESRVSLRLEVRGSGGQSVLRLPRTGAGGYFSIATSRANGRSLAEIAGDGLELKLEAIVPRDDTRRFEIRLPVPPRRVPLLVVSDVDDTIRIAEVTNRPAMIERVFLRPYEAVPGMSAIYAQLASGGARFHYVSGSPWQLEPVIREFLLSGRFPLGVLHCRHINWDFWNGDSLDLLEYKVATIERLLAQFASGGVLLIGDSGELDPEVYSRIARDHADRVAAIWIRLVNDAWDSERLAQAAARLGADRVMTTGDAAELAAAAEQLATEVKRK